MARPRSSNMARTLPNTAPQMKKSLARSVPLLAPAVSALALGVGLTQPSLNSLISRRAGREEQGEVMCVSQSIASLSRVLGPAAAGFFFAEFGRNAAFFWGAALVAAALMTALRLVRGLGAARLARVEPLGSPSEGDPAG